MTDVAQPVLDEAEIGPVPQHKEQPPPIVDTGLAIDGNAVEFAEPETAFLEAVLNRFGRQPRQCLTRRKRSSSAAAMRRPSRTRQAAESP